MMMDLLIISELFDCLVVSYWMGVLGVSGSGVGCVLLVFDVLVGLVSFVMFGLGLN